ncbi:kinase-like domain-containing protein [Morchella snyderi]|nr:kinase-like domain-containing protein [Morchella snyderi]
MYIKLSPLNFLYSLLQTTLGGMEFDKYRLEATFSPDRSSVSHTIYRANHPPTVAVWTTSRPIGRGCNGVVDLQSEPSGLVRAVKRVYERDSYMKEVIALSKVSDRRDLFVDFFGWYEDRESLYIAMEYVANGDLGVYIKAHKKSQIPEATCQEISKQLLEALQVLHERLICHRDLKPQNVLVAALEPIHVKITDFGVSKYLKGTECRTRVGTSGYMAPEIQGLWVLPHRRRPLFGNAVDLWAAGCIIHELLSLQLPFAREWEDGPDITMTGVCSAVDPDQVPAETDMASLIKYCQGDIQLPVGALERSGVSPNPMELIQALLRADPAARMTAMEALKTPWMLHPERHLKGLVEPTALALSTSETLSPSHPQFVELEALPWKTEPPPGELTTPIRDWLNSIAFMGPPSRTGAVHSGSYPRSGPVYCKTENCLASDKSKLKDHKRRHLAPSFPCLECSQKFKQERILKRHIARVHKHNRPGPGAGGTDGTISDAIYRELGRTSQMHALNMQSQNWLENRPVQDAFLHPFTFDNPDLISFDPGFIEFPSAAYTAPDGLREGDTETVFLGGTMSADKTPGVDGFSDFNFLF